MSGNKWSVLMTVGLLLTTREAVASRIFPNVGSDAFVSTDTSLSIPATRCRRHPSRVA